MENENSESLSLDVDIMSFGLDQYQHQKQEQDILRMSVDVDPSIHVVLPAIDVAISISGDGEPPTTSGASLESPLLPPPPPLFPPLQDQTSEIGPNSSDSDNEIAGTSDKGNEPTTPNIEMAPPPLPPPPPVGNGTSGTRLRRESKGGKNSQLPFWMRSDRWPSIGTPSLRQTNPTTTTTAPPRMAALTTAAGPVGTGPAGATTANKLDETNPVRSTESTFASLLQPILALFPPQPAPAPLLPTIDLHDPIEPKPTTMTHSDTISTSTSTTSIEPAPPPTEDAVTTTTTATSSSSSSSSEPFVIHRPAILKPLLPRTAARLAYTFDWRIDVFGDSPNEVKTQRTKYPKPVLPPIPPSEPLELSLDGGGGSSLSPQSQSQSHHLQSDAHPRRSPSAASLRHSLRKERSRGSSLMMMSRAMENIRRGVIGAGRGTGSTRGVGTGRVGGRARSASVFTSSSSCLSNVSLPSFVSGMSGSDDHSHYSYEREHELVTPFGSEVAIDERLLFLVRREREGDDDGPVEGDDDDDGDVSMPIIRDYVDPMRELDVQESPTAPLREGVQKLGLITPPPPPPLLPILARAAFIPYSEPVKRPRGGFEMEEEDERVDEMGDERRSYPTGMTPFTPLTPRSVPSDESDDDDDDDD